MASGRFGVSKDDVFNACETLLKKGVDITVVNVRAEIGNGSYSTILPHINAFKVARAEAKVQEAENKNATPVIPVKVREQGREFIESLWLEANALVQKRIEEMTSALSEKNTELSQAVKELTRIEGAFEEVKADLEGKTKTVSQKDGEINLLKNQLKEKDLELRSYLERAIAAEKKLELFKEGREKKT